MIKINIIKTHLYIVLFSIGLFFSSFAQANDAVLAKEINSLASVSDANLLNKKLQQLNTLSNQKSADDLEVVYKVFLANLYAQQQDAFNQQSTQLHKEAVDKVQKSKNKALQIWVYTKAGFYFYSYNKYEKALYYFTKSSFLLDLMPDDELLDGAEILKLNGYFLYTITEYDKSIAYLVRALTLTPVHSKTQGDLLNMIGNCYLPKGGISMAETYFEKAKQSANQNNDKIRYAKVLGDLAKVEMQRKNWHKAEALLLEDIQISEEQNSHRNTMYARLQLGKLYIMSGNKEKAYQALTQSREFAKSKTYLKGFEQENTELLLQIVSQENKPEEELLLRRTIDSLSIQTIGESKATLDRLSFQLQKEKIEWQLKSKEEKYKKVWLQRVLLILISLLLLAVIFFVYITNKRRLKLHIAEFEKKILSFQYQKIQSEKKLTETHNSIVAYKTYLLEKNEQINRLEQEINRIKKKYPNTQKQGTTAMEELLSSHLMTDDNWLLFKEDFIAQQPDYYNELLELFPGLTESNLRIIILQKIGLNNQETARMLCVTVDAVKKAKQRLRKKYDAFDFGDVSKLVME